MKTWTYVGVDPRQLALLEKPNLSANNVDVDVDNSLEDFLFWLARSLQFKGYTFKPTELWQTHLAFASMSFPGSTHHETPYDIDSTYKLEKAETVGMFEDVFEILEESQHSNTIKSVLYELNATPDFIVYYDESGNLDYVKENMISPTFVGYNLANVSDVLKLSYIASCDKRFWFSSRNPNLMKKSYVDILTSRQPNEWLKYVEGINKDTVDILLNRGNYAFYEQVTTGAINSFNKTPYGIDIVYASLPSSYKKKNLMVSHVLATNLINKTLTRFLATSAFKLAWHLRLDKDTELDKVDVPKLEKGTRLYIMEDAEYLPKDWPFKLKDVIVNQAKSAKAYFGEEAPF